MSAALTKWDGPAPARDEVERRLTAARMQPQPWSNAPGDRYGWHDHAYTKVLYCVSGTITFHTDDGDFELAPGDRLDVEPGTRHAATVGPAGVECIEGHA